MAMWVASNEPTPGSGLHPDGDRFILAQDVSAGDAEEDAAAGQQRFIVVTNWFEELRQRMDSN